MSSSQSIVGSFLSQISFPVAFILNALLTGYYYSNIYNDGTLIEKQIKETSKLENQEQKKKKETEKLLAEQEVLKQEVGLLAGQFKDISSQLPLSLKTQEVIDTINKLAKNSGCRVVSIKPERTEIKELYEEIPIRVELNGQFSSLVMFMYYIASLERVTDLDGLQLMNEAQNYTGNLKMSTTIVSFKYRPPEIKESDNFKIQNKSKVKSKTKSKPKGKVEST